MHPRLGPKHITARRYVYLTLLGLPVAASIYVMVIAGMTSHVPIVSQEGIFMSPVADTAPLQFSLALFTLSYLTFVIITFKDSILKIFKKRKKNKR